jgi:rod shape-determining protein MreC
MPRFSQWLVSRRDGFALLCAVILSIVLLFSNDQTQIHAVRGWMLDGFGFVVDKISFWSKLNDLYKENQQLRRRSAELLIQNSRLREAGIENERLRTLLDFKSTSQLELIPARVVGKGEKGLINSILISTGRSENIRKNMAVVNAAGLVGKIYQVGDHYATVQIVFDRNFRVSAMVQRSRTTGIVRWQGGSQLVLGEIPKRSDIETGDTVITSGLSLIFPGGLDIGTVTAIDEHEDSMFMDILVEPIVDFQRLEEVLVIRSELTDTEQ